MIFFLTIIIIIFLNAFSMFVILNSTLYVEIEKFNFNSNNIKKAKVEDYLIYIRLKFLNKVTFIKIKIDDDKINKITKNEIISKKILERYKELKNILLNDKKEIINRKSIEWLKDLDIQIEEIDLHLKIGALNCIITSLLVSIISMYLSIKINKCNKEKCRYLIEPIYKENIQAVIKLNCIIKIKMVNIINIVYILLKKGSVNYDERTSDRRTYVCSND